MYIKVNIMKAFLFIILWFFLIINYSQSAVINDLEVNGNKRISKETIVVLGKIEIGRDYNNSQLNIIIKNLYDSGFFSNVSLKQNSNTLLIDLVENPIIENINITGINNSKIEELLYEKITLKNRMSFSDLKLQKDIILIENLLKSDGYYFSKVETSVSKNENLNSILINISIEMGEKVRIKRITFIGDKKVKDKKLLEIVASEEHKFWKFISNNTYLNENRVNLDKRLLENFYRNSGYYNVKIGNSFAELNNDNDFNLIFNIQAGEKYFFNDFKLELPNDYLVDDFNDVKKIFSKLKNKTYSLDDINLILKEINKIASLKLYEFIDAKVIENINKDNKIDYTFKIIETENYFVERINVKGNFNTIEQVIRNQLIVDEGDPLNKLLFDRSIENLKSLNIFKNITTEIKDGSNNNLKVIDLNVEEQPTGEISLGAGVGTSGTTIGGGIVERNFLGKGINLNTNLEISEESLKGQFIYAKPNFAYTDNTLFTSLKSTTTDNLSDAGYKSSNLSFSLGTSFEQFENIFFRPEIDIKVEDIKTNSNASKSLKKQEGTYEDLYFNYSLTSDLRNSKFNPSSGSINLFSQELPVISGNNEIKNTLISTRYKSLNESSDMIGRFSLYLSSINSMDSSDVRISKRLKIPYDRLRGFQKNSVGPRDENLDYVGGNYVSTINLSTTLPQILNTVENVDMSYFIDLANIWGVDYDKTIDDSNSIRGSTGLGLNLITPIGPLSFSLSQPLLKKSTDKTETFRFNLGTTF